jgi:hypothetical protein
MAMHEGIVVPIITIGDTGTSPAGEGERTHAGQMLVVQHAGELVGLIGAEVVRTGSFPAVAGQTEAVEHDGRVVPPLDVAEIYARVQSGARAGRWG